MYSGPIDDYKSVEDGESWIFAWGYWEEDDIEAVFILPEAHWDEEHCLYSGEYPNYQDNCLTRAGVHAIQESIYEYEGMTREEAHEKLESLGFKHSPDLEDWIKELNEEV